MNRKHTTYNLITICLAILLIESVLTLAFPSLLRSRQDVEIPDKILNYRGNPKHLEHDKRGFRNPTDMAQADIVAMGDSQTYGTGVNSDDAWPRQLERLSLLKVYSMSFGGWGPTHSLILFDDALKLNPNLIIVSFYSGNDLYDSYDHVHHKGQVLKLKSSSSAIQEAIEYLEKEKSIEEQIGEKEDANTGTVIKRIKKYLLQHSNIYAIASTFYDKLFAAKSVSELAGLEKYNFNTTFTPDYRLKVLNLDDARIVEGHNIALRAIDEMNNNAKKYNKRFIVVLIPTKEFVFRNYAKNISSNYDNLVKNENKMWQITKEFFRQQNIEYFDAGLAMEASLIYGIQPYPITTDGHPNKDGHSTIARFLLAHIQKTKNANQ